MTTLKTLAARFAADDRGFVASAELVLVATIAVLSMIVGLAEVAHGINEELEDVGSAFGAINQSYEYSLPHGHKGCAFGSEFQDRKDDCDGQFDISCDGGPRPEDRKHY